MTRLWTPIGLLFASAALLGACASDRGPAQASEPAIDQAAVTASVERLLPLLQSSARTWIAEAGCVSCHHQGLGLTTVALARERGFAVDEAAMEQQTADIRAVLAARSARFLAGDGLANGAFSNSYMLLALSAVEQPADSLTDTTVTLLAALQAQDGGWFSNSSRPPLEDSRMTGSALCARGMLQYAPQARREAFEAGVTRSRAWLTRTPAENNEDRTWRLFGLAWSGADESLITAAADELLAQQRSDGSWAQISTRAGDAYATGQALVALHQAGGLAPSAPAYRRGVEFLLDSQEADGSWHVLTRRTTSGLPFVDSEFPHQRDQFLSYAASSWACMALILSAEGGRSRTWFGPAVARAGADGAGALGLEPVHLAAAFGSPATLRALLEAGADPDALGPGGLTPLHLARRDPQCVALLLEHGAALNAQSQSGRTTLWLAAGEQGTLAILEQLLEAGADGGLRDEEGLPLLARAACSGEVERLYRVHASVPTSQDDLDTALQYAAILGDPPMLEALLELGADPSCANDVGETPLILAIGSAHPACVRALLAHGARVDARDAEGMTALAWAARIDPGHAQILDALLAAGADPLLVAGQGRTALEWAEFFGHDQLAERLRNARPQGSR